MDVYTLEDLKWHAYLKIRKINYYIYIYMTSLWSSRITPADNAWRSVTYGNGLFVAVAGSGTGNRVMTSPDGITWTSRITPEDNYWRSVTYGNGLFVAVAESGTGNRVMTSPDGITWTSRITPADNWWRSVTYGNGLFVAIANSGTGNRVMTSPDGITWSLQITPNNNWYGVTYGNGLFVAVAGSGTGNRVMTASNLHPIITNFSIPTKIFGDAPFQITQPTSNSSGSFSYASSNLSVATISGNTITIVGVGNSTITATQADTTDYTSGTITTAFQVNQATPTNPVIINNSNELLYFMNTSSTYANVTNSLEINENLVALSYKVLTGDNVKITKLNN
jgi:hypothetical protein